MTANKTALIVYLFFGFIVLGYSQKTDMNTEGRFNFPVKEWNIGLAYFGESLLRPGMAFSVDYPFVQWNKTIKKRKGTKYRSLAFHLGGSYWNYYQKKSHVGNALDVNFFVRRTKAYDYKNRIGVLDFGISAGFGWNRLLGGIYETTESGFKKASRRQAFFSSSLFVSLGRNLTNRRNVPIHWFVKPKIFVETPYAPFPQIHPSIEVGVDFPISVFSKKNNP